MNEEKIWLEKARKGDKVAFSKLIEMYQKPVYNITYRMLNNRAEAEDAAQEVFIRAFSRLHSYKPQYKFSSWLFSITSNYCIDQIRKRKGDVILMEDDSISTNSIFVDNSSQWPEEQTIINEQQATIQALLQRLEPEYRLVVVLHYWYGLSYKEIANICKTSLGTIRSRLFRARKQMAQLSPLFGLTPTIESETTTVTA